MANRFSFSPPLLAPAALKSRAAHHPCLGLWLLFPYSQAGSEKNEPWVWIWNGSNSASRCWSTCSSTTGVLAPPASRRSLSGCVLCTAMPVLLLLHAGLIDSQGRDAFCRRVIFSCRERGQIVNFYGRSIGAAFPHRLLPRSKGGLFAWASVRRHSTVILVEGLFDLAVLW